MFAPYLRPSAAPLRARRGSSIFFFHEPADAGRVFLRASERHTSDANAWLAPPLVASYLHTITIFRSTYCTTALFVRANLP